MLERMNTMLAYEIEYFRAELSRSRALTEDLIREKHIRDKTEVDSSDWKPIPGYTSLREKIRLAEKESKEQALKEMEKENAD